MSVQLGLNVLRDVSESRKRMEKRIRIVQNSILFFHRYLGSTDALLRIATLFTMTTVEEYMHKCNILITCFFNYVHL